MKKKDILFTFDYELFLGEKSGSVDNCMIKPTNLVVEILDSFNVKGIFFVDCTYLYQLKNKTLKYPQAAADFQKITNQLQKLVLNNHEIYPHIHSHWLNASYNSELNEWNLSNIEKYRFDSLNDQEKKKVFNESYNCLFDIIKEANENYKMNAYRAGGWCIQPFSNFEPFFTEHGIEAEFSVLGGAKKYTNAIEFDFSKIKSNSSPYYFNQDVTEKSVSSNFKQYPITSIELKKNTFINKITSAILWRTNHGKNYGDGRGVNFVSKIEKTVYDNTMEMVSIELLTLPKLYKYKKLLRTNNYLQFISHPKMLSPHNLLILKKFLKFATKNFSVNSDWKKIQIKN